MTDTTEKPLQSFPSPTGLVYTPQSIKEFQDYLDRYNANEKAVANVCGIMGFNTAAKMAQDRGKEVCGRLMLLLSDFEIIHESVSKSITSQQFEEFQEAIKKLEDLARSL